MNRKSFLSLFIGAGGLFLSRKARAEPTSSTTQLYDVYVAGVQHHDCWHDGEATSIQPGTMLVGIREPDNPHDHRAIALYAPSGRKVGYVPRWMTHIPARLMDGGHQVQYRVVKFNRHEVDAPWHLIKVAIELRHSA